MGPCVESCVKSGALSPSRSDGDGRISTGGPAGRAAGAVAARIASKLRDFSAPYSCCDNMDHRPSVQMRCTNVWLPCPCPPPQASPPHENPLDFRPGYPSKILHREAQVKRFVGPTTTSCGAMPYTKTKSAGSQVTAPPGRHPYCR